MCNKCWRAVAAASLLPGGGKSGDRGGAGEERKREWWCRGSYRLWGAAGRQVLILLPQEACFVLEPTPETAGLVPGTSLFCSTLFIQPAGEQLPCSGHLGVTL